MKGCGASFDIMKGRHDDDGDDDDDIEEQPTIISNDSSSGSRIDNACQRQLSNPIVFLSDDGNPPLYARLSDCPICFEEYKERDEICWSHNPQCRHAFHRSCAESWFLKHDECPCCRANYLDGESSISEGGDLGAQPGFRCSPGTSISQYLQSNDRRDNEDEEDSGYSSDTSSVYGYGYSLTSDDAVCECTINSDNGDGEIIGDDIESQASSSSSSSRSSSRLCGTIIEFEGMADQLEDESPQLLTTTTTTTTTRPQTAIGWHSLGKDAMGILKEMRGAKSDDSIRYGS